MRRFTLLVILLLSPALALANEIPPPLDLTGSWVGFTSIALFFIAYLAVMTEEALAPAQIQTRDAGSWPHLGSDRVVLQVARHSSCR